MRKERIDLRRAVRADAEEHVAEVLERIHSVRLAGGDDRVEGGDVVTGVFVTDDEKILPAESRDAKRAFGAVVIWRYVDIVEDSRELGPIVERVSDR